MTSPIPVQPLTTPAALYPATRVCPETMTADEMVRTSFWFRLWLACKPIGGFVGYKGKMTACPLAAFLTEQGFTGVSVFARGICYNEGSTITAERWQREFILLLDFDATNPNYEASGPVTREEALTLLDRAVAMSEALEAVPA